MAKSIDGGRFEKAYIETSVQNNGRGAAYNWVDRSPVPGYNFYRIKITEANGTVKYSGIVKVLFEKTKQSITLYPNPLADGIFNLYFASEQSGTYNIRLLNSAGQLIEAAAVKHSGGSMVKQIFRPAQQLLHGNYILEITRPDGTKQTISAMY